MMPSTPTAGAGPADCWNQIGVRGDQSCPKLEQHVHCRNCEVYAGAAQRLLQRPVGAAYGAEWAAHFRQPARERSVNDSAALAFRIGSEWLALPARSIKSVAPTAPGHRLPHRSGGALNGIVNVGGTLLPAVSLAALMGVDERSDSAVSGRHAFARLVIVQIDEQDFAVPVAELHGIVRYAGAALKAPPTTVNKALQRFLSGVLSEGAMQIGIIDIGPLGQQMTRLLR